LSRILDKRREEGKTGGRERVAVIGVEVEEVEKEEDDEANNDGLDENRFRIFDNLGKGNIESISLYMYMCVLLLI